MLISNILWIVTSLSESVQWLNRLLIERLHVNRLCMWFLFAAETFQRLALMLVCGNSLQPPLVVSSCMSVAVVGGRRVVEHFISQPNLAIHNCWRCVGNPFYYLLIYFLVLIYSFIYFVETNSFKKNTVKEKNEINLFMYLIGILHICVKKLFGIFTI